MVFFDGEAISYYENGNVKRFGQSKRGANNGIWYYMNEQGDTIKTEVYNMGKLEKTIVP